MKYFVTVKQNATTFAVYFTKPQTLVGKIELIKD